MSKEKKINCIVLDIAEKKTLNSYEYIIGKKKIEPFIIATKKEKKVFVVKDIRIHNLFKIAINTAEKDREENVRYKDSIKVIYNAYNNKIDKLNNLSKWDLIKMLFGKKII